MVSDPEGVEAAPKAPAASSKTCSLEARAWRFPTPRGAALWGREAAAVAGLQSGAPRWKYTVSTTRLHPCIDMEE